MWTMLVLVVWGSAPSQMSVPGFSTQAACVAAAEEYRMRLIPKDYDPNNPSIVLRIQCVRLTKETK